MFKIYHEYYDETAQRYVNVKFYDDTLDAANLRLTEAKLSTEIGTAGTLEIGVPIGNVCFGLFNKFTSVIRVERGEDRIFTGRVYSEELDFEGISHITCEGLLAILNDSVYRPEIYNGSLSGLLSQIIQAHNSQVNIAKRIDSIVFGMDDVNVDRQYENYESTMARLTDLVDTFGGHLKMQETSNGLQLTWDDGFVRTSQNVTFTGNLLDLTQESNGDELATVVIPLGAEVDNEDGTRGWVTIESIAPYVDYIEDADAVANFGKIVKVVQFNDVTVPSNLYAKATEWLADHARSKVSIEVTAIDMAGATLTGLPDGVAGGVAISYWKVGDQIKVAAPAYGVNDWLNCLAQDLDLMNPAKNEMTLSTKKAGYVGSRKLSQTVKNRLEKFSLNTQNAITNSANTVRNELNAVIDNINGGLGDLTSRVETAETWIASSEDTIAAGAVRAVEETYNLAGTIEEIQSQAIFSIDPEKIQETITNAEKVDSWMSFSENGLEIGRSDSDIYSEQDNDSYSFRSRSSGEKLLEINEKGIRSDTVNVNGQMKLMNGGTDQWAIRNGAASTTGSNFDIVWIG